METMVVVCGDSSRMSEVVGMRPNLYFTGGTSGTSLQECFKSDLKVVPKLPTSEKHEMMASARVKDDSRSTSVSRGRLLVDGYYIIVHVNVFHCHATPLIWTSLDLLFDLFSRLGPAWNGTHRLVSVGPAYLRGDHPPLSSTGSGFDDCKLPFFGGTPA